MIIKNTMSGENTAFDYSSQTSLTDAIDREIYNRLQLAPLFPIGSLDKDSQFPMQDYINQMELINSGTQTNAVAIRGDEFLGSLGVDAYYPHYDNTYKGELLNG